VVGHHTLDDLRTAIARRSHADVVQDLLCAGDVDAAGDVVAVDLPWRR
jgi:hypothetical protein